MMKTLDSNPIDSENADMDKIPTPNLDAIKCHRPEMQAIHNFLEFMEEQGYTLSQHGKSLQRGYTIVEDTIPSSGQKLDRQLAKFYEFDYDAAEQERQAIIDSL
jgi:hypothetical protein